MYKRQAVSSVIKSAVSDSDVQVVTDFLWQECLNTKCAVYEFGITVPFNEYFNGIGVSEKKAPDNMSGFTSIVAVPFDDDNQNSLIYFIDTSSSSNEACLLYTARCV